MPRLEPLRKNRKRFNPNKLSGEIKKALRETGEGMRDDLQRTTKTWKTKVDFVILTGREFVTVYARGSGRQIYQYVDEGTRPHKIRARKAKVLAFRAGYKAKTVVNQLSSRSGGSSGAVVLTKSVNHPGSAPRNFTKAVLKKWDKKFGGIMDKVIKEGIDG